MGSSSWKNASSVAEETSGSEFLYRDLKNRKSLVTAAEGGTTTY